MAETTLERLTEVGKQQDAETAKLKAGFSLRTHHSIFRETASYKYFNDLPKHGQILAELHSLEALAKDRSICLEEGMTGRLSRIDCLIEATFRNLETMMGRTLYWNKQGVKEKE